MQLVEPFEAVGITAFEHIDLYKVGITAFEHIDLYKPRRSLGRRSLFICTT